MIQDDYLENPIPEEDEGTPLARNTKNFQMDSYVDDLDTGANHRRGHNQSAPRGGGLPPVPPKLGNDIEGLQQF